MGTAEPRLCQVLSLSPQPQLSDGLKGSCDLVAVWLFLLVRKGVALSYLGTVETTGGGHVTSMPGTVALEPQKAQKQDQGWALGRGRATCRPPVPAPVGEGLASLDRRCPGVLQGSGRRMEAAGAKFDLTLKIKLIFFAL